MPFVTDTHAFVWHLTANPKLSDKSRRIFADADQGKETVHIPCVVLFELTYLVEKKKVPLDIDWLLASLNRASNYRIEPMCISVIEQSRGISRELVRDPWDRLIAGTAIHLGLPLITRDPSLQALNIVTIW